MSKKLDLIDRNELYNQIRLYLNRHSLGETAPWTTLTTGEIASIIVNMPAIDSTKWISVKEPPKETGRYYVWDGCRTRIEYFYASSHLGWAGVQAKRITHWMPLPEPPEGDKK